MIKENLKRIRKTERKTYQEVADAIGVSKPYYWQIENGKRRLSYELAVRIAAVFNKKPDDIFLPEELTKTEQITKTA
ncbi:helix-turn-helix transcriptional regulator [Paenibacillus senegalensis]|uniref:helix-turn-helix transcriptional regulator n=1 Tax=Paenibacillus senegalensis TaxID=1465766 RepID=UPI000287EAD2|nr:helix-turn-helix transcriptional regulator [Paenibacillus senegalensis]